MSIVYKFMVPEKYLEKMVKIKEEDGLSIAQQIKMGMEEYLFRYEMSKSPFMKSLGEYKLPEIGETLITKNGKAEVLAIRDYQDVLDELEINGCSRQDIEGFSARVEHFLGNKKKYFECDIQYQDGEIESIDWSEYLAFKNRKGVVLRQNLKELT